MEKRKKTVKKNAKIQNVLSLWQATNVMLYEEFERVFSIKKEILI